MRLASPRFPREQKELAPPRFPHPARRSGLPRRNAARPRRSLLRSDSEPPCRVCVCRLVPSHISAECAGRRQAAPQAVRYGPRRRLGAPRPSSSSAALMSLGDARPSLLLLPPRSAHHTSLGIGRRRRRTCAGCVPVPVRRRPSLGPPRVANGSWPAPPTRLPPSLASPPCVALLNGSEGPLGSEGFPRDASKLACAQARRERCAALRARSGRAGSWAAALGPPLLGRRPWAAALGPPPCLQPRARPFFPLPPSNLDDTGPRGAPGAWAPQPALISRIVWPFLPPCPCLPPSLTLPPSPSPSVRRRYGTRVWGAHRRRG
jgi:hypothetical protein